MRTKRKYSKPLNEEFVMRRNKKPQISRLSFDNTPYIHFHTDDNEIHIISLSSSYVSQKVYYMIKNTDFRFEYSLDLYEWYDFTWDFIYFFDNDLYIRGVNPNGPIGINFSFSEVPKENLVFDEDEDRDNIKKINYNYEMSLEGDIRTLIDWENYEGCDIRNATFISLFAGTQLLVDASKLKLDNMVLAPKCYCKMFYKCKNLLNVPELPAKNLSDSCYDSMFLGCESLKKSPVLPAENLAKECYKNMFTDFISLEEAPILPAKKLFISCYENMFQNCYNLTTPPELPALSLAPGCYRFMFLDCRSLQTAPDLPATNFDFDNTGEKDFGCYERMFLNCTSLRLKAAIPKSIVKDLKNYERNRIIKSGFSVNGLNMYYDTKLQ